MREAIMAAAQSTAPERVVASHRRRAVIASTVGTTVEWYDFFLYGTAAALVFPRLFFPGGSAYSGVLASFATQFVGFAARPIGAAVFGRRPWYRTKTNPSTADMLAKLRRVLIAARFRLAQPEHPSLEEIQTIRLAWEDPAVTAKLEELKGDGYKGIWLDGDRA